jgi:hypothetical protein
MQAFVNGWVAQSKRHGLTSELVLVEWNPPADRPRLVDALYWPADLGPCQVRIIQVSPELHRRYSHAEALPLYQMLAKNVGIRRAHGRFVLATNIDIIFSDELVSFLAAHKLEPRRMYRIDRHDVMSEIPIDGIDQQLEYCRTHLIRLNAREGTFNFTPHGRRALSPNDVAAADSGITFGPGWFPLEWASATENFRWAATRADLHLASAPPGARHLRLDIEPSPGAGAEPLEILLMGANGESFARVTLHRRGVLKVPVEAIPGEAPGAIRFRVLNGGRSIPLDTRILEFRVFRCDWEMAIEEAPITVPPPPQIQALEEPVATPPPPVQQQESASIPIILPPEPPLSLWVRLQRFLEMAAYADDAILVRVPIPQIVKRVLRFYLRNGGLTGLLMSPFRRKPSVPESSIVAAPTPAENPPQVKIDVISLPSSIQASADPPKAETPTVAEPDPVEFSAAPPEPEAAAVAADPHADLPPPPPIIVSVDLPPVQPPALCAPPQEQLHTNGCGDFTLMARENWLDLRGYPEFDTFSMHLDSIFCLAAHHGGVVEEMLLEPMCIYHIEHGTGSGWTPEGQAKLFARIAERGLTMIDNPEVIVWAKQMQKLRAPMIFNLSNWGLADIKLPETTVTSAFAKSV